MDEYRRLYVPWRPCFLVGAIRANTKTTLILLGILVRSLKVLFVDGSSVMVCAAPPLVSSSAYWEQSGCLWVHSRCLQVREILLGLPLPAHPPRVFYAFGVVVSLIGTGFIIGVSFVHWRELDSNLLSKTT